MAAAFAVSRRGGVCRWRSLRLVVAMLIARSALAGRLPRAAVLLPLRGGQRPPDELMGMAPLVRRSRLHATPDATRNARRPSPDGAHSIPPFATLRLVLAALLARAALAGRLPRAAVLRGGNHPAEEAMDAGGHTGAPDLLYDGRIEVIVGPMFSGKSTELLRRLRRYKVARAECLLLKFAGDGRYSETEVVTHDATGMPAQNCARLADAAAAMDGADVVGIDEGQFFDDLLPTCERLANAGKVVIVAALDGTFQRKPFEQVVELCPLAERVDKLSAVCVHCTRPAAFSKRIVAGDAVVDIGGADKYEAVCRRCFFK